MVTVKNNLRRIISASILLFASIQITFAKCDYKQSIKGEQLSVGVMLNWSTSSETENAMFIIERSDDGIQFTNVGAVKGAGHSTTPADYSFLDSSKPNGQRYYRLRQIDFSGIFTISPIFVLNEKTEGLFSISSLFTSLVPNQLEVQFNSTQTGQFDIELMDWQGKSLFVDNMDAKKGANTLTVNLSVYSDLIYQLTMRSEDEEQTITFRKK